MARFSIIIILVAAAALIGAGLWLAYGNFPAPTTQVEKVLPNDRFGK